MKLEEYSRAGDKDCFTYWLEERTESLGSISGGSAFKFGIYERKDHTPQHGNGVIYGPQYAWGTKHGNSPDEAFTNVRAEIVKVANAARRGDLSAVEQANLGPVTKWKIAFLYQDRAHPSIINIFKLENLRAMVPQGKGQVASQLHPQLAAQRGGRHVLEYADELWGRIQQIEAAQLAPAAALKFLQESDRFSPVRPPVEKMAGFRVKANGREVALARDNKQTTIYLSPGPWIVQVSASLSSVVEYAPAKSRSSNIAANAPTLAEGNAMVKVTVPTLAALQQLCDAYEDLEADVPAEGAAIRPVASAPTGADAPLNQILYGPPGTGKTFRSIEEALRIVDPAFLAAHLGDRTAQKLRFDELVRSEAVRFVTFHQSFSYEDFVEGIRAAPDDETGALRFDVVDGIFKTLCDSADVSVTRQAAAPRSLDGRTVWKMSLGNTMLDESDIYEECIANGYALLGFGSQIDFGGIKSAADVADRYRAAGKSDVSGYSVTAVATFILKVKVGDLLVVTDGNFKFRAIGEVTGGYEYAPRTDSEGFAQRRRIKWLRVFEPSQPYSLILEKQFVQRTLYELRAGTLDRAKLLDLLAVEVPPGTRAGNSPGASPKVLIIDEINRGNVSRIFGELITLLEDSKRKGRPEALEVRLPYSKKKFSVPQNVYLIGTMNTADRSLTGLDIALRRRFSFVEVGPQPELLDGVVVEEDIGVGDLLRAINARIEVLLDRDHRIGHSYFLPLKSDSSLPLLASIFQRQILPLLQEYFFDDWGRIRLVLNDHRKKNARHRFLKPSGGSIEELFGAAEDLPVQDGRWRLNEDAFKFAASYLGTIKADV
ncbi:MAG TPA: AAA family ATPase [Ramlibacter sp.]